jgi:hypothetical protein
MIRSRIRVVKRYPEGAPFRTVATITAACTA